MQFVSHEFNADGYLHLVHITAEGVTHRSVIVPGGDVSTLPTEVQEDCTEVWTPEVVENYEALQAANTPTPEETAAAEASRPLAMRRVACAKLQVDGYDITGIERSEGLSMAFMLDENTAWVFFTDPQPDTNYIVMPADGVVKYPDYIEVVQPGMSELSLIVFRVQ